MDVPQNFDEWYADRLHPSDREECREAFMFGRYLALVEATKACQGIAADLNALIYEVPEQSR